MGNGSEAAGCFRHDRRHWLLENSPNPQGSSCHGRDLPDSSQTTGAP